MRGEERTERERVRVKGGKGKRVHRTCKNIRNSKKVGKKLKAGKTNTSKREGENRKKERVIVKRRERGWVERENK